MMDKKEVSKISYELLDALNSLKRTHFVVHEQAGLRRSEIQTLLLIGSSGQKPITVSEIAKKIGVTLAAVTHQINSLEEQGYLTRLVSEDDKRVVLIKLTPKGKEEVSEFKKRGWKKICGLVEYLGDKHSQELISMINKLSAYMKSVNEKQT